MLGIGAKRFCLPVFICFGNQGRKFAKGRGLICQTGHAIGPLFELHRIMRGNLWFHAMIYHHFHVGIAFENSQEIFNMTRKAQRLETKAKLGRHLKTPLHIAAQHPVIIGNILYHGTYRAKFWMPCQPNKFSPVRLIFEINPSGYPGNMRRRIC